MVSGRKRIAVVILIAVVSVVAMLAALSYSSRRILTESEVRLLILCHPSTMHFEVKPGTIEFLSLELVPIEESPLAEDDINGRESHGKVWVVEYECEGRVSGAVLGPRRPPPPFTRKSVQVVMNARIGSVIEISAKDIE